MASYSTELCRNFMLKSIMFDNTLNSVEEIDDETRLFLYSEKIKKMLKSENEVLFSMALCAVASAFVDAYKILNYKSNILQINEIERKQFIELNHISTMDDLIMLIDEDNENEDSYLLEDLFSYQLEFIRQNELTKIIQFKMLTAEQQSLILDATIMYDEEKDPYHCENSSSIYEDDNAQYNKDNVAIEKNIINYYMSRKNEIEIREETEIAEDESWQIIMEIFGFLKLLATYDYEEYYKVVENMAFTDYKWDKYIVDHKFTGEMLDVISMKEDISSYELFKKNNELVEILSLDHDYLLEIIYNYIDIKCYNRYINEMSVNEELVDDYYFETQPIIKK